MEFEIGQTFEGRYPPEAARWCNLNRATIVQNGVTGWRIEAIPPPTDVELQAAKLLELANALEDMDWRSIREHDRRARDPKYFADTAVFAYKDYLRNFDKQEGRWWEMGIQSFEDWRKENFDANQEG
jgi:hypothetical protein